jgi:glutathione S-transferase
MKLYHHPASTTSRPVMLFAAENRVPLELQVVDLFTGEHYQAPYEAVNPNHLVPVLEDGAFRLTESSAILKYLADKAGSPLYPKDLQSRARVNERMDWVNTQLCRDFAYGFVYPQIFSFHKRRSDEAQQATLQWGKERAQGWIKVLDQHLLGPGNAYLCGDAMTIADYYAAPFVALDELLGGD